MKQKQELIKDENILVPGVVTQKIGTSFLDVVLIQKDVIFLTPATQGYFFQISLN